MIQIEKVEISYFRSIYTGVVNNIADVAVLSGKNDSGKSNVLRALNLFFNNQTEWNTPFDFSKDFCLQRKVEVQKRIKSKQFIRVTVHFVRGKRYDKSLPDKFWVSRTWYRDSNAPIEKNSLRAANIRTKGLHRAQASLQRYLNTIRFEYVPAIKDHDFFNYSLGRLQDTILEARDAGDVKKIIESLNEEVHYEALALNDEFLKVAGIKTSIDLPADLTTLFRAFTVSTGDGNIPLIKRGDGIQARFLPSLLYHIASRSNKIYIWGFEEPENCLEHSFASQLADEFVNNYAISSQVIITSHSPAFVYLENERVSLFRVLSRDNRTECHHIPSYDSSSEDLLSDLGLLQLQRRHQKEYLFEKQQLEERVKQVTTLYKSVCNKTSPVLLVEGKTDVMILEEAWRRLFHRNKDFRIVSCDISAEGEPDKAGCSVLKAALESCRPDLPKTIGLFDSDFEGCKAFDLNKNFKLLPGSTSVKIGSNKHVAAMILSDIPEKQQFIDAQNLVIEFVFPDHCLDQKIEGRGLVLKPKNLVTKVGNLTISVSEAKDLVYQEITNGKNWFAEKIVPTLTDSDFENFRGLFTTVEDVFNKLN